MGKSAVLAVCWQIAPLASHGSARYGQRRSINGGEQPLAHEVKRQRALARINEEWMKKNPRRDS